MRKPGVYKVAFPSSLGGGESLAVGKDNQVGKKGMGREEGIKGGHGRRKSS